MADLVPCPKCGSNKVQRIRYAIWGGFIGPMIFKHTRCIKCNATFNGITGKSNTKAIFIYNTIVIIIAFLILLIIISIMKKS